MSVAFVFPGQGSQYVGMGAEIDPETFREADDALGYPLSKVIAEGPEAALTATEVTQPAILAVSIAMLRRLRREVALVPVAAAGHSLGEYSALAAAGSLSFGDALRLVRFRGKAMQEAVPRGEGGMAAVMGLERAAIEPLVWKAACGDVLEISAANGPSQTVVAGHVAAIERLVRAVEEAGGAAKKLEVSAPFHCRLLAPAGERLAEALSGVEIRPPTFPVLHNVDGAATSDPSTIRERLVAQVSRAVLWEECVRGLVAMGATHAVEIGPGRTLAGLIKRIDRRLAVVSLDTPSGFAQAAALGAAPSAADTSAANASAQVTSG